MGHQSHGRQRRLEYVDRPAIWSVQGHPVHSGVEGIREWLGLLERQDHQGNVARPEHLVHLGRLEDVGLR